MKKNICVSILFLALAAIVNAASERVNFKKEPFFPIVGYNFLWCADEQMVKDQSDMGLTMISVSTLDDFQWCEKYGLKGIYYNPAINRFLYDPNAPDLTETVQADVNKFLYHPAFYAVQIADEPNRKAFEGYAKVMAAIKALKPDIPVYTNLFPDYSQPYQHGFEDYRQYAQSFSDLFKLYPVPIFCYDNYSNKNNLLKPSERQAAFLGNLEVVREITLAEGIPFWVTVIATAHDHHPDPNEADINFEVFSALAYGAKGIGYFTTTSHISQIFQGGPFDVFNEKTPLWRVIRDCNYRVRKLAPYLLKIKSTGAFYALNATDKNALGKFKLLPGRLVKSLQCDRGLSSFLVGEFTDANNEDYIMVVNLNLNAPARFTVVMVGSAVLEPINSYSGTPAASADSWLRAGKANSIKSLKKRSRKCADAGFHAGGSLKFQMSRTWWCTKAMSNLVIISGQAHGAAVMAIFTWLSKTLAEI